MVRDGYYINDKVFKLIKMKIKNEFQKQKGRSFQYLSKI